MDNQLLEIFAEESNEIIDALEQGLIELEDNQDPELINAVFRAAHTMKGNAGIVGFENIVDLTHLMESLLDEMRSGVISPDPEVVGLLLTAVDALKVLLQGHLAGEEPARQEEVMKALTAALKRKGGKEPTPPPSPAPEPERPSPAQAPANEKQNRFYLVLKFNQDLFATGTDPLQFFLELEELATIDRVVCHSENLPPLEELNGDDLYLWWEVWLTTGRGEEDLKDVFLFVYEDNPMEIRLLGEDAPEPTPEAKPPLGRTEKSAAAAPAPPEPEKPKPAPKPKPKPAAKPEPKPAPQPAPASPKAQGPSAMQPTQKPQNKSLVPVSKPMPHMATIRVETDKLDKLVNLVGELVIGVARVNQIAGSEASDELGGAVEALDHISRDLQEQVMRVRMIPVEGTFQRFQRVVRDLAAELGKKIRLSMSGTETELDKNVIEQIADPLKHLIRNSADHGVETPEERIAAGKSERGTIWLMAYQQEGKIIIEVKDDGRGIDREKILQKAIEKGFTAAGAQLSDSEVFAFMFQPGFSTAAKVTEVSGRGGGAGRGAQKHRRPARLGGDRIRPRPGQHLPHQTPAHAGHHRRHDGAHRG